MVAGVASAIAILCLISVLLAVCIMRRRRARRLDREHITSDGGRLGVYHGSLMGSISDVLHIHAGWMHQGRVISVADDRDFNAWGRYSDVSSHGTLGQRAMSIRGIEHYPPSLSTVSTLPEYAETQRSVSPPGYSNSPTRQSPEMSHGLEDRKLIHGTTQNGYFRMED